ncbi:D-alanine--D-alanine ligase [Uliginosibacterium sp. H1]|uniref:D-alanine--D-alanine ligase n=1 Tax=Uliginosibacterium sp. H1 TaxID=3114757 RepID=UPI002E182FA3|nr:D-alanine--D-alanine ligase [Uliginosibacterium sp. H1]
MSQSPEFGKVAVLLGGHSAEREVSLMSGNAVLAALQSQGVDAHAFDPAKRSLSELKTDGFERAFVALHGRGGEDGSLQGALQWMGIPYTGSGVMASAVSMDKWRTKLVWIAAGLPTPRFRILYADTNWDEVARELGLPIFVKPVHEGSSVGATKVTDASQLKAAWELAARYDSLVIAEEFVDGEELTAPFLGDKALPLVRIVAPGGNYDYQNKYFTDVVQYHCPSGLPAEQESALQAVILRAAQALGCRGWGRADLMLRDGKPYLLEMNTAPGMTGHSLVPMSARAAGMSFEQLCVNILELASLD